MQCPSCNNQSKYSIIGVEYCYGHPERYDGVSEWRCGQCHTRWGRWSGKILKDGEAERRRAFYEQQDTGS